jgi:FdhD protein
VELEGEPRAPVEMRRNFVMTSACGVCGKASLHDLEANTCPILPPDEVEISPEIIHRLPDALRQAQNIFESTGGLHAAARFDQQRQSWSACAKMSGGTTPSISSSARRCWSGARQ